jgi:carbon storage regulator
MLVLTRKTGQKLIIADNIEVTVLETKGESVKIGIQAPRDVSVYREEIYQEIKKANTQATDSSLPASLDSVLNLLEHPPTDPSS